MIKTHLRPVGRRAPPDDREAPVVLLLAGGDGLNAFVGVAVLVVAHVTFQAIN